MHRRQWDSPTNANMVIQDLEGKPIADICHEHQSSPSQYDLWRDQCLAHAAHAFEVTQHNRTEARLAKEHTRLNTLVGELTRE